MDAPGSAGRGLAAFVAAEIGRPLSDDAISLLRLAVHLGVARAQEREITLQVCASWRNLLGAALLATDPASRWLQEVRPHFDVDELLPTPSARLAALRAVSNGQDQPEFLGAQVPTYFTPSVMNQLRDAASMAGPALSADGEMSASPAPPAAVRALHIVGSMIIRPDGEHGLDPAVGRGDRGRKSEIMAHMAKWMADSAFAIDPPQREDLVAPLRDAGSAYPLLSPELAAAAGVIPKGEFKEWLDRLQIEGLPYPEGFSPNAWRACGPLGRVLAGWRVAPGERFPAEWAPFLDLLTEAMDPSWVNRLPGDGGLIAGRGITLFARASALAERVDRGASSPPTLDLRHLIGAVLAQPGAALPPAFEPFPVFRDGMSPRERQSIRHRFLHHVQLQAAESERGTIWSDLILGERLVTARIPTDLSPADDLLGFGRYANAFASVIADLSVAPPLAVGLFGPWGSGKSAMIGMIDAALADIDERAAHDEAPRFCRGIVRVVFNAWHYAETNLWASLFVRVLEAMSEHLRERAPPSLQDERHRTLEELEKAQAQQRLAEAAVAEAELDAAQAAAEVATADLELTAARQAEAAAVAAAAEKARAEATEAATRLNALEVAGDAAALLFAFGRPTAADLAGEAGQKLEDTLKKQREAVSDVAKSLSGLSGPLQRLQLILGWRKPHLIYLVLAAMVALPIAIIVWFAQRSGLLEALASGALSAMTVILGALAALAPIWARARDALRQAPAMINKLADAAEKVRTRAEERDAAIKKAADAEAARKTEAEKAETAKVMARAEAAAGRVAQADKRVATARAGVDAARQAVAAAAAKVEEKAPERLLSRFVEERAASEEYARQLGLPTRIRRDLKSLREYLENLSSDTKAKRRADRVVLFIDDLDRCAPGVVVKVLEAVHILLASELFVVVVGVDVRWLKQALATHHAGQFHDNAALDPEEFLEKIFQVPFWIPSMAAGGREAIVRDALPEVRRSGTGLGSGAAGAQSAQARTGGGGQRTSGGGGGTQQARATPPLPTLEAVQLGEEEHRALLRWGAQAGDTPRRLKRFARSYLILRASLPPAERDAFLAGGQFDTIARLLALNVADPDGWSAFARFVEPVNVAAWPTEEMRTGWRRFFAPDTQPPTPADCRAWLPEVERFGFLGRDAALSP